MRKSGRHFCRKAAFSANFRPTAGTFREERTLHHVCYPYEPLFAMSHVLSEQRKHSLIAF